MLFFKRKPGIAVIEMHGIIGTTIKEPEYSRLLESVQNNQKIGALVLDIDSPVGSATAGGLIYENGSSVAQRKPVVAPVRGLGKPIRQSPGETPRPAISSLTASDQSARLLNRLADSR